MNFKHFYLFLVLFLIPFVSFSQVTGLQGWDIFVDPGHSQNENMPPFSWGIAEAKRNVRVALELRDILMSETDIDTVYLSRTNDQQYVTLSQRTDLANSLNAQWYHSIHTDASSSPAANSTLLLWGQYQNGNEKIPNGGKAMSDIMIQYLTNGMRTYTISGSIGDCSFYGCTFTGPYLHVNRETIMPSELSEAGFHTNYQQNQLYMNSEWRRLEARTFYWSILDYHNIPRPPANILTGIVTNAETDERLNGAVITAANRQYTTDTFQSLFYMYTSDPDLLHNGFYYFEDMDYDSVEVTVEKTDFYPDTVKIAISDDFFTFQDFELVSRIPPFLVSSTPANGDSGVSVLGDIILNFSRPMDKISVQSHIEITPDLQPQFYWGQNDTRLVIRSDSVQFLTTYRITLPGTITDKYGHLFDGDGDGTGGDTLRIEYTTGMDVFPPDIVSFYPRLYQTNVERQPIINIGFNEVLADTSVKPDVFLLEELSTHTPIPGIMKHYVVDERSVLNYFPGTELAPGKIHVARVFPGLQDLLGNTSTRYYSVSFTSMNADAQDNEIDHLEPGFSGYWWQPGGSGSTTGTDPQDPPYMAESDSIFNILTGSTRSMELYYSWDLNAGAWLLREYLSGGNPRVVTFDTTYTIQCYIFGDGSGTLFRFALDEGDGTTWPNHEVSLWTEIDWIGWKMVEWDLSDPASVGSWAGLGNSILDMPRYRMDSFQLMYQPGANKSGSIYIDDLNLIKLVPPTSIEEPDVADNIPDRFSLEQNYPNPFNPTTRIAYSVPERAHVKIAVYNSLGQQVRLLVSEEKMPGIYQVDFDASGLAAGIYVYRMSAGNFSQTRKLVLLK